jgi:hypothetical protein
MIWDVKKEKPVTKNQTNKLLTGSIISVLEIE